MADITMTNGNRYTFSNSSGNAVLQHSTDHVGEPTYFNNQVIIGTNTDSGQTDTPSLKIESWNTTNTLGPSIYCRNVQGGDVGIAFDANGTDFVIGIDAGETDRLMIGTSTSPSATDGNNICEIKARHENTTADDHILIDFNPDADYVHSIGKVRLSRAGLCGSYNSSYVQQIWSIGYNYSMDFSVNSEKGGMGDLWGLGYFHTNSGLSFVEGGAHQMVFAGSGTIYAGISLSTGDTRWNGQEHVFGDGSATKDRPMGFDDADIHAAIYVRSNDQTDSALVSIDGGGQGDGILYVGQGGNYGGGILYRGDGTHPSEMGNFSSDVITLFRNEADSASPVIYWSYNSNNAAIIGTWTTSASDRRLKENIRPITGSIDKIKAITGVHFDWNDKSVEVQLNSAEDHAKGITKNKVGVIAQEVQAVLPEAIQHAPFDAAKRVSDVPDDPYLTVDYESLIPLLIEGVKEQQTIIEDLKARIEALES
jgi:hypothetical protein